MNVSLKPTPKQYVTWRLLLDRVTSYILFGGAAGGGKSYLSASWLFTMASSYAGTRWFIGRNELKAIRSSWLQTFYKVVRDSGLEPLSIFKYNAQDNFIQFVNGSRIDLLDLGDEPGDPFFERLGSFEFTGGVIEEAGEVSQAAFDILKARIGRCMNEEHNLYPKILLTSNPKKNWLYYQFYKPFTLGELALGYAVVLATAKDNEYMPGYTEQLMKITDPGQRERLLGNWEYYAQDLGMIEYQAILDCFSGAVNAKVKTGDHYISADVARFGSDSTVICLWSGLRCERVQMFEKLAVTQVADKINELKTAYSVSVSNIVIDSDGVGGGVSDLLPGARQFVNNSTALEVNYQTQNFANLKSQCYTKLAEMINEREIYINLDSPDMKANLIQELEQVKLKDKEGKLGVISKAEVKQAIGRSPDLSDALMMRMIFELEPQFGEIHLTFHSYGGAKESHYMGIPIHESLEERKKREYNLQNYN